MDKSKVQIILLPYDSGNRGVRMGAGPEHFVENGLAHVLESDGHRISVETIESQAEFRAEVQTQFELYTTLAGRVAQARREDRFPLILSGNCGATVGAIAGIGSEQLGVVWFDAHGEFNTPETTTSGFLDGMGLSIATGSCWKKLALSIPNFRPVPGAHILLIGGRDFDEGEKERLEQAGVTVVDNAAIQEKGVHPALSTYLRKVEEAHLHIDLDVLNPKQTPANSFLMDDEGLSAGQLSEAIGLIKQNMKVTSATIASYDPAYDPEGKTLRASFELIKQIVYR